VARRARAALAHVAEGHGRIDITPVFRLGEVREAHLRPERRLTTRKLLPSVNGGPR